MPNESQFRKELEAVINRNSMENGSNTPDFILAVYLSDCLRAYDNASRAREAWYAHPLSPGFKCADMPRNQEPPNAT